MFTAPSVVKSAAAIVVCNCVLLTKVVGRAPPFHRIVDERTNPVPVTCSALPTWLVLTGDGVIETIAGAGLFTIKWLAADVPPPGLGVLTVTELSAPLSTSAAVIAAVRLVALL